MSGFYATNVTKKDFRFSEAFSFFSLSTFQYTDYLPFAPYSLQRTA
jgi:hypothetical protein